MKWPSSIDGLFPMHHIRDNVEMHEKIIIIGIPLRPVYTILTLSMYNEPHQPWTTGVVIMEDGSRG